MEFAERLCVRERGADVAGFEGLETTTRKGDSGQVRFFRLFARVTAHTGREFG